MMMRMKRLFVLAAWSLLAVTAGAQTATTFEMRYFTPDAAADGVTDFHGETEWFTASQRVEMLGKYARYASRFWGDPGLDTPLFGESAVTDALSRIKPQPLTSVRRTIPLERWVATGYKKGKEADVARRWQAWTADGARIDEGKLMLDGVLVAPPFDTLSWRFRLKVTLSEASRDLVVRLCHPDGTPTEVRVPDIRDFELYGDIPDGVLFLSQGGKTLRELPLKGPVCGFSMTGKASVDAISLYDFVRHADEPTTPYRSELVFEEDFEPVPSLAGWQEGGYDDTAWQPVKLPSAHGGASQAGEDYDLRTRVKVGSFTQAFLHLDALDPAGEVWINGQPAAVLKGRTPYLLDVAEYLRPGEENLIAVKVKPFYTDQTVFHAPSDHNFGWFLGEASLQLVDTPNRIVDVHSYTLSLKEKEAVQHHKITVRREDHVFDRASLCIRYSPWFPVEGPVVVEEVFPVELRSRVDNVFEYDIRVPEPACWSPDRPQLYKVEVILRDEDGKPVDDCVVTTGIRLIQQKEGVLYVNHRPEVLGGGQNFGYRLPLETVARTVYCPEPEQLMRELLMAKSLGNLLRVHVHARTMSPEGTNDPRIARWADQLGLYLIWQTPAWTREGEGWNVDIAHYPVYMREVYNHPSIVMWEAGNHPNWFLQHGSRETQDYMAAIIPAIALTDSSRLISPTTAWDVTHYGNYEGTVDLEGNPLEANPWLMHPMMTRGVQDSYSGYDNPWSEIRNMPRPWAKWTLEARDLCYFNFEHEESIGMPNWSLARKEPWYRVDSYEKNYEEGNIGVRLSFDQWRESQAYQAFSAWESMKMQLLMGTSGFSWCSLESGPNMFTYQKPVIDAFCVPKLAFHANRMAFQRLWAASDNVDTVYGPGDSITPVIFNLDGACKARLEIRLQDEKGKVLEKKVFKEVAVPAGRSVTRLSPFRFRNKRPGCHFIVYQLNVL